MIDIVTTKNRFLEMAIRGELVSHTGNAEQIDVILTNIEKEYKELKKNKETKISKTAEMQSDCLFSIPANWKWVPLGKVCIMLSRGKSPKYSEKKKYPVFAQKCNQPNELALWKARFLDETTLDKWPEYFRLRDGDIVINSTGTGTVGRIGYYLSATLEAQYPFMLPDSHVTVARIGEGVISKYIYYVLRSSSLQNIMEKNFRGSTNQKEFYIDSVYATPIPLPPTEEQLLIVEKLDALFEKLAIIEKSQNKFTHDVEVLKSKVIDSGIQGKLVGQLSTDGNVEELLEKIQIEKAELIKEKKIKKEKALPEISDDEIPFDTPKSWKWVRLRDICKKIVDGDHNPPAGVGIKTEYLMLSAQNVNDDKLVNIEQARYLTEEVFAEENKRTQLEKGDVLLTIVATLGRSCVYRYDYNVCFQRSVCVISTLINPDYLKRVLDSTFIQKYMVDNATGAAQPGFYLNKVEKLCIPVPPLEEQERIVERIDNLLSAIEIRG